MKINSCFINRNFSNNYSASYISDNFNRTKNIPSDSVLNYLKMSGNYNLAFQGQMEPFYSIDENLNYTRYTSRKQAADDLKTSAPNITRCLKKERCTTGGNYFIWASELEREDENGNKKIDEEVLLEKVNELRERYEQSNSQALPIYTVDEFGNYQRYESAVEAAKATNSVASNITKCLKGKQKTFCRLGAVYASEVEYTDESGNICADLKKLEAKRKEVEAAVGALPDIRPFYAVSRDGGYKKYTRKCDAEKDIGVSHININRCLEGKRYASGGYTFFYADEVETTDSDGNVSVNINISDDMYAHHEHTPMYALNAKGKLRKYSCEADAAKGASVDRRNIYACITGERETAGGIAFIRADELETVDDMGRTVLDYAKAEDMFKKIIKDAVYIIKPDKTFKRYNNASEAAEELGVNNSLIINCANGLYDRFKEYTALKALYVESYNKGDVTVNYELLEKTAQKLSDKMTPKAFWAIDKNNKRKKYKSIEEASDALGISKKRIRACLSGKQKTTQGLSFKYVEKTPNKRPVKKKALYAMNSAGDVYEFKNAKEAAKALNICEDDIVRFLRTGKTRSGAINLSGYVFSSENDS